MLIKAIEMFNSRLTPDQEAFRVLLTALCNYGSVEEEIADAIKSRELLYSANGSFTKIHEMQKATFPCANHG